MPSILRKDEEDKSMDAVIHSPIWIMIAKSLLALIMLAIGLIAVFVYLKVTAWRLGLQAIESECDMARDNVMLQGTVVRFQLAELQERLKKKPEKAEMEVATTIIKQAIPVLSLLIKREGNLIKWAFSGAKLAKSVFEYFSNRKD
jgi:hypothetical protein